MEIRNPSPVRAGWLVFEGNSMHGLIKERLEDYLRGAPGKEVPVEFERHLQECEDCREEVRWMREQTKLLRTLAAPDAGEPPAGFYARVLERIEAQRPAPVWAAFLDPVFGRRLVATSLALAMLFGGYLAFTEADSRAGMDTAGITAFQESSPQLGQDRQRDRDTTLVTLVTYRE